MFFTDNDESIYLQAPSFLRPECEYLVEKVPMCGSVYRCVMKPDVFITNDGCPKDCERFLEREYNEYD